MHIKHHFDSVWIEKVAQLINAMRGSTDGTVWPCIQQVCDGINKRRVNKWLVSLNIHHNIFVSQTQKVTGLGKAVATTGVVITSQ